MFARGSGPDLLAESKFAFGFVSQFSCSCPRGNFHGQRRGNVFALPPALQPFKLVHGAEQLPFQSRFVTQYLVQNLRRGQHACRLPRLLFLLFMIFAFRFSPRQKTQLFINICQSLLFLICAQDRRLQSVGILLQL